MEYVKLGNIAKFRYGKMPDKDKFLDDGYPVFSGYRITGYYSEYMVENPTLIVVARGVGGTGDVKISPPKSYITNLSIIVDLDESVADMRYLYYQFVCNNLRYLDTGAAQSQITINNLSKHKALLPRLVIQKKISSILTTYDNLIENNNKRIKLLEQMAENLYKEWFIRFRFPGYEDVEFEDGMPKNWVKDKIRTYYETTSGGTPKRSNSDYFENGNIPWLKTAELKDCIILDTDEHITELGLNKSSAKWLPNNSVAMAMYAGNNVGKLGYLDKEMTCSQACCILYDKRKLSSKHYLFHYLLSIREYLQNISFGAAQQNISQDLINKVNIIMPDDEVVRLFEEKKMIFIMKLEFY